MHNHKPHRPVLPGHCPWWQACLGSLLWATLAVAPQALAQSALTPSEVYRERAEAEKAKREEAERKRQAAVADAARQRRDRETAETENQRLRLELQALKDKASADAKRAASPPVTAAAPAPASAARPAKPVSAEPNPLVDGLPRARLEQLQQKAAQRAGVSGPMFTDRLANGQPGPVVVVVPEGRFQMGSSQGENDENPVRPGVRVASFGLMQTEVTVGQYLACVAERGCAEPEWRQAGSKYHYQTGNDNHYQKLGASLIDPTSPVVGVSWENGVQYAAWLSKSTQQAYRLPTEAEWEYAARAGSQGQWSFGDDESQLGQYAWYSANSGGQLKPVGTKQANHWQLKDLHGSVWELVQDCYHSNYSGAPQTGEEWSGNCSYSIRVVRGGSLANDPVVLRSANRSRSAPDDRDLSTGFRLARTL